MNVRIKVINVKKPNITRCKCGECDVDHKIMVVTLQPHKLLYEAGLFWCPTETELEALTQQYRAIRQHNINVDKFCYKGVGKI